MSMRGSIAIAAALLAIRQDGESDAIVSCSECAGSGITTYAKRGFYQTTCRRCWGKGYVIEKRARSQSPDVGKGTAE
jgi:DnaJ-class molecular chaperone